MGFIRGIGYFIAVIILIFGIISLLYGVPWIGLGIIIFAIIIIAILRHFAKNEQMRKDIHYMAEHERKIDEEKAHLEEEENKILDEEKEIKKIEEKKKQLEKEKGD